MMNYGKMLFAAALLWVGCGGSEAPEVAADQSALFEEATAVKVSGGPKKPPKSAYFCATDGVNWSWGLDRFVVRIDDPKVIEEARQIIQLRQRRILVGDVISRPVAWNSGWNFYIDPPTVGFAEAAIEVCDGTAEFVEQCGGPYFGRWCPWKSYLIQEIGDPSANNRSAALAPCASDGPRTPPTYTCSGGGTGP